MDHDDDDDQYSYDVKMMVFGGLVSVLNVMLISLQQRPWSAHWLLGGGEVTSIAVSSQYSIIIITFISSYQYHDHTARR